MKYRSWIGISFLLSTAGLIACGGDTDPELAPDAAMLPDADVTPDGGDAADAAPPLPTFDAPESVHWDADLGVWYVSSISGDPTMADGVGWITRLDASGEVDTAHWVEGLNAPKGMAILNGTLYVADIDYIVAIDTNDGTITERVQVEESQFLNDVAASADGFLYITDTFGNAIYRMQPGQNPELFLQSDSLKNPNGILVDGTKLVVGSIGDLQNAADLAPLLAVDLTTKEITQIGTLEGKLDGIALDGNRYIVSDFRGQIHTVGVDGSVSAQARDAVTQDGLQAAADIGFDPVRRIVAIPDLVGSTVVFVSLDYEAPESAAFDEDNEIWYVSNIGAGDDFAAKDGNGYISRLDADGNMLEARWVEGLDAPKGMAILDGTLYVADVDQIVPITIEADGSGTLLTPVAVDGAQFLNDVAANIIDGSLYVTDTFGNAIYRIPPGGTPELFLQDDNLENPNGVLVDGTKLIVGSVGSLTDFTDLAPMWSIDLTAQTPTATQIGALEGKFDGLVLLLEDNYAFSDFRGEVQFTDITGVTVGFRNVVTQDYLKSAADIGYDSINKKIAVPDLLGNSVIFLDLVGSFRLP